MKTRKLMIVNACGAGGKEAAATELSTGGKGVGSKQQEWRKMKDGAQRRNRKLVDEVRPPHAKLQELRVPESRGAAFTAAPWGLG